MSNPPRMLRRHSGPRPLADFVAPSISDLCGKAGFSVVEVVTHWDEIVGPDLAPRCMPVRLQWPKEDGAAATLMVRVEGAYAIELQYAAGVVVERINAYFGWRCVGRLALRQGPVPQRHARQPLPPKPEPSTVATVRGEIGAFEDEALASSLARLGALVRRERGHG
ncbi:DciA family protein [Xanthobacter oligotrophicus]|uniref:DciA family protein n=1 Tax=Xanthobacter oligotrophicus TaxID=2607286 RepID=A0ABW6ZVI9_9HYPH